MILDKKTHLKAKQYQCVMIDEETHRFQPKGTETETVDIDHVQLVEDFAFLISEYAKCPHLRVWIGPLSYKGISSKKEQNRIYTLNNHIYEELEKMIKALLAFINKYGLFGLMNDEAVYDYNHLNSDGSYSLGEYPETAYLYREDSKQVRAVPYDEYIKPYFPEVPASEAIRLKDAARTCQYTECMEDILQNRRILACTDYVAGMDKQSTTPLIIHGMNAALSFKGEVPVYDIRYRSLIEYCHSMFFLNEIAGKDKMVRICQYRLCHKPHFRNSKYCCDECMIRANKHTTKKTVKKGDQNNG